MLPAAVAFPVVQVGTDGAPRRFTCSLTGRARPARVDVHVAECGSLAGWLVPGRHAGVQWGPARLRVRAPAAP